jgi:hypothetical protein
MAAKFFTGLPLDGPDPECVQGYGELALASVTSAPKPTGDHSHTAGVRGGPVPLTLSVRRPDGRLSSACDESPLAGLPV